MSFDQLETVVAVAEEGTVVRAADRLCLTQPPVSRRLLALEDELGVTLFERTARRMRLTPAGEVFLSHARSLLDAARLAKDAAAAAGRAHDPPTSRASDDPDAADPRSRATR